MNYKWQNSLTISQWNSFGNFINVATSISTWQLKELVPSPHHHLRLERGT